MLRPGRIPPGIACEKLFIAWRHTPLFVINTLPVSNFNHHVSDRAHKSQTQVACNLVVLSAQILSPHAYITRLRTFTVCADRLAPEAIATSIPHS